MGKELTRRQILSGAALAAATGTSLLYGKQFSALASVTVGPRKEATQSDTLVILFLRGGADGLNIVIPHAEDEYYKLRPSLALARPKDGRADKSARTLDLDGFFGLHPALEPLYPLYKEGKMGVVHAVGSGDQTRSHFEAMAAMERGLATDTGSASGWLARHLASTAEETDSPLRAVSVTETMPDMLRGATNAVALTSLSEFRLVAPQIIPRDGRGRIFHPEAARASAVAETLRGIYGEASPEANATGRQSLRGLLTNAGRETLDAIEAIKRLDPSNYKPAQGVTYSEDETSHAFRQVACLIKGEVGMEVAFLDMGGWDTHFGQGRDTGLLPSRLGDLGRALASFIADLGTRLNQVSLVVMTEFGRRAYENFSLGTDHGRASFMFLFGGGIHGGKVHAEWPGLAKPQLEGDDLRVTTDYRDILSEILVKRVKNTNIGQVFPEYTPRFRNVVRAA
jgi:uncharacterized protein (DUF1501 family)